MTIRRNFLKGTAASGMLLQLRHSRQAQPKGARLPVKVGGKRVLTVDVHARRHFRESFNLMGDAADKGLRPRPIAQVGAS